MSFDNTLTKQDAEKWTHEVGKKTDAEFSNFTANWSNSINEYLKDKPEYLKLREKIVKVFQSKESIKDKVKRSYEQDMYAGLSLYESLSFPTITASNDDVWRYLSCKVFPDITYKRYPKPGPDDERLNSKRFYSHTRRIWVKTLWWFVHLSWQNDFEKTEKVLKEMSTDSISQLIERTGRGYRLPLYREMVKQYSEDAKKSSDDWKRITTLNNVKCRTIEPALTENKEKGYVSKLIDELKIRK